MKLFVMDRPNMRAVQQLGGAFDKLWKAMQQVTGYGITKHEYQRWGMLPRALLDPRTRKSHPSS